MSIIKKISLKVSDFGISLMEAFTETYSYSPYKTQAEVIGRPKQEITFAKFHPLFGDMPCDIYDVGGVEVVCNQLVLMKEFGEKGLASHSLMFDDVPADAVYRGQCQQNGIGALEMIFEYAEGPSGYNL